MPLPDRTQYIEAIQNLRQGVSDEELRAGELAVNPFGLPLVWSGNFADVYRVHCPQTGNSWAVKCFTRETPELRERYREISAHLKQAELPFTVDFQFVEPGLLVAGRRVPFLKMRWVEGLALNTFASEHADHPQTLRQLLEMWPKLAARCREAGIAHGDLQHGNVLLVPVPGTEKLSLKLVDYDGMFVPTLAGHNTGEVGHPSYQHPQRLREAAYNAEIDRFSHLAIYTALRALLVGGRELWTRHDNGDNFLFRESDFRSPHTSPVFWELWESNDREARALLGRLALATNSPLEQIPDLDDILKDGHIRPLSPAEERQVAALVISGDEVVEAELVPQHVEAEGATPPFSSDALARRPPLENPAPVARTKPAVLRQAVELGLLLVRVADRLLGRVAGKGNTILHQFLRVAAAVCVLGGAVLSVGLTSSFVDARLEAARTQQMNESEDRDLYDQILRHKPDCREQIAQYLETAPLRRMERHVRAYGAYLDAINHPLDLHLELTSIDWHGQYYRTMYNTYNDVTIRMDGKSVIEGSRIVSKPNRRTVVDVRSADFTAYVTDEVSIEASIVATYGLVFESTFSGGSGSWRGTVDALRAGVTINLAGDGFTNSASLRASGGPKEPILPAWGTP